MSGTAITPCFTDRLNEAFRGPVSCRPAAPPCPTRIDRPTQRGFTVVLEDALNRHREMVSLENGAPRRSGDDLMQIAVEAKRRSLVVSPGQISEYLHYNEKQIRILALRLANQDLPRDEKIAGAEQILGAGIPGDHIESQHARVCSARFWRRALKSRIVRAREHFFMRLKLIGSSAEHYVSDAHVGLRAIQLKRQSEWLAQSILIRTSADTEQSHEPLPLAKLAKTPSERFAKLYTFIKAIETLSVHAGLRSAMITATLEAEWHPNPSHGDTSWNGLSPLEAHKSFCHRWQAVLRDLHRRGIRLSGLRVTEPHKDGCPHYHIWANYQPDHENAILEVIMRYFPNKLKIRGDEAQLSKFGGSGKDVIFEDLPSLVQGISRRPAYAKEGAQVEVSLINRTSSSGASYATKYLLKAADGAEEVMEELGLSNQANSSDTTAKREQQQKTAKRVDAFRFVWGIHKGQLFGIAKCLTAWDEMRRLNTRPEHSFLRKLWIAARGCDKEGRIGRGAGLRGDAVKFLELLGGLDAARKVDAQEIRKLKLSRLVESGLNRFGDAIKRTKGLKVVEKRLVKRQILVTDKTTGRQKKRTVMRTDTLLLAEVVTKLHTWAIARAPKFGNPFAYFAERYIKGNDVLPPGGRKKEAVV